jgi:hypothetical protein
LNSIKRREKEDGGVVKLTREEVRENRVVISFFGNSTPSLAKDKRTWTISFDKQKEYWLLAFVLYELDGLINQRREMRQVNRKWKYNKTRGVSSFYLSRGLSASSPHQRPTSNFRMAT